MEKLQKFMKQGAVGAVVRLDLIRPADNSVTATVPEIEEVLQQFQELFEEPKGLPPERSCDHTIPLKSDARPVNIRPYRIPHYQKDAMEGIIDQLLRSEFVRHSVSPYSSPAILVRKKDGT